jgi:hypothetical protein
MKSISTIGPRIPPTATPGFATKDGVAVRRADKWENTDTRSIGSLNGTPAAKSDPQGSPAVEYGPSSKLWRRGSVPTTKPQG